MTTRELRLEVPYSQKHGCPDYYTSMKRSSDEKIELIDASHDDGNKTSVIVHNKNSFECLTGHRQLMGEYNPKDNKWNIGVMSGDGYKDIDPKKDKEDFKICARFFNSLRSFYLSNEKERDNSQSVSVNSQGKNGRMG